MRIKSQAPTRISLFGGGTDVESYSSLYGGLVISFAINLRNHLTLYTGDDVFTTTRNEVPYKGDINFMHTIFTQFDMGSFHDVRFISKSDALLQSGLGTSASALVATIGAINKARNLNMTRPEIAEFAWQLETGPLGLYSGRQDTYASAFGGFNMLTFSQHKVEKFPLDRKMIDQLLPSLVLIHTGSTRENPKIQEGFKKLSLEQVEKLDKIKEIAHKALEPLQSGDIEKVGSLLNSSWELKKQANTGVNSANIDKIEKKAKELGAVGFKVCGAGEAGYALCVVNPDKREKFIEGFKEEWTDFSLSNDGVESRIL